MKTLLNVWVNQERNKKEVLNLFERNLDYETEILSWRNYIRIKDKLSSKESEPS